MKKVAYLLILIISINVSAQENEENSVMEVVNQVFEAMRTNDSTLLKSSFIESPNMFTSSINSEGKSVLSIGDFQQFKNIIGQPKDKVLNEPIWNEQVQIDDNLASVWVDYAFYVDDQFSHCGVDAFHLVKLDNQWKIFHLVDTRRKIGCEVPDEFKP